MHFFQQILQDLDIRYTVSYAKNLFESRTDSSTLYGIKKMLEQFGLTITAIRVSVEEDVTYPCIWQKDGWIRVLKSAPKERSELIGQVVLLVTDRGAAREPDYIRHQFQSILKFAMPYISATAAVFLVVMALLTSSGLNGVAKPLLSIDLQIGIDLSGHRDFDWHLLAITLLNALGFYFSWRTIAKECSGTCHEVLGSAASKLFGLYSLGVVGATYFLGSFIIALFIPTLAPTFALFSFVALIMPLWSISYQAFVIRAWCRNCLGVQGVLILSFITELLFHRIDFSQAEWLPVLSAVAIYFIIFYPANWVYEIVQREKGYPKDLFFNYMLMMKNPEIKETVIRQGKLHDTTGASTIIIKDCETPSHELLLVISPFCTHCQDLFKKIREMLDSHQLEGFRITILFAPADPAIPVYGSVIAEYQQHGPQAAIELLNTWYSSFKISRFRKKYSSYPKSPELEAELARQKAWFEGKGFHSTPIMLVDSHEISYQLLDGVVQR